jgi:hypothetical protein
VNGDMQPEGSSTATASGRVYGLVSRRRWALALVRSIKYAWMCACYYSCSSLRLYLSGSRLTALWRHFSLKPEKRRNNSRWSFVAVPWTMHASRTEVWYFGWRFQWELIFGSWTRSVQRLQACKLQQVAAAVLKRSGASLGHTICIINSVFSEYTSSTCFVLYTTVYILWSIDLHLYHLASPNKNYRFFSLKQIEVIAVQTWIMTCEILPCTKASC